MSHPAAPYMVESRTYTGSSQIASTQSWKKTGASAHSNAAAPMARTAAPAVEVNRSFADDLARGSSTGKPAPRSFEASLSLADPAASAKPAADEFSFDDIIDIINPLQHLPVISMLYRELTSDTIKPMAQIVGGGLFGGPVGAVSGTVNAVVQESTGKDIAGNVLTLVVGGSEDSADSNKSGSAPASIDRNNPEMALSLAAAQYAGENFVSPSSILPETAPTNAMAFAPARAAQLYEKTAMAEGRTAGSTVKRIMAQPLDVNYGPAEIDLNALPARESITALPMNGPAFGGLY